MSKGLVDSGFYKSGLFVIEHFVRFRASGKGGGRGGDALRKVVKTCGSPFQKAGTGLQQNLYLFLGVKRAF